MTFLRHFVLTVINNINMGQDAHRKYKEFKKEENRAKKWGGSHIQEAKIKELEWKLQKIEDDEDFKRGLDLLNRNEY